jgi:hypothetical protein
MDIVVEGVEWDAVRSGEDPGDKMDVDIENVESATGMDAWSDGFGDFEDPDDLFLDAAPHYGALDNENIYHSDGDAGVYNCGGDMSDANYREDIHFMRQ